MIETVIYSGHAHEVDQIRTVRSLSFQTTYILLVNFIWAAILSCLLV